ncbi:DUF6973 domain-containing protein [Embleya scabrispora]|uniref:DUF6973 domain-containing protein n=1 Tax=Embleya scabrispora TaxID=159449 RepID=UPI000380AAAD|nr:hypothetical protein [Embleya scabrispora]MYS87890.1 hypothetical protein [Streptomyces sp. SID5474]
MLTLTQLRDANIAPLAEAATAWETVRAKIQGLSERHRGEVVNSPGLNGWSGTVADTARARLAETQRQLGLAAAQAAALSRAISDAHTAFTSAQTSLRTVLEEIARFPEFTVREDGGVDWRIPDEVAQALSVSGDGLAAAQLNTDYTNRARDFAWRVGQALAQATQADNDAQWDIYQDVSARDDSFNPHATLGRDGNGADILTDFQAMDDPHGTTKWPGGIIGFFTGQQQVTRTEAELLDRLGWLAQKDFSDIKDEAFAEAQKRFTSDDKNDDHQDAFRHTYWNALLTQRFGADWTAKYTTAHEGLPGNPGHREAMDLYNNDLGRRIAQEHPNASPGELADYVDRAVREGQAVVVDRNHELVYSDQEEIGRHTVIPKPDPPLPAHGAPPQGPPRDQPEKNGYDPGNGVDNGSTVS